ncbi:MAG: YczE/YyaS/YitT family protein [Acidimicrobiales bacterium]
MWLAPVPSDHRARRAAQLIAGLTLYGTSDGLLLRARLGVDPWDVLHQGLSRTFGLQVGTWSILVGAIVLVGWAPLRQRLGVGTLCNVVLIGVVVNVTLSVFPPLTEMAERVPVLVAAVFLNGVATGLYIGAGLGPGPRDGLMTGISKRGHSLRATRTVIELMALAAGWALGGNVGAGTILYALSIGPIVHLTLPALRMGGPRPRLDERAQVAG